MRRGTTPVHVFSVDIGLENLEQVYVTYQQNDETIIEKDINDVTIDTEEKTIKVQLTQEDTLKFSSGVWDRLHSNEFRNNKVKIQIRLKFTNGNAPASNIITTTVDEVLKDGEI